MNYGSQLLLIGAVFAVGVLHTIVPDHWLPITVIARQRGWSKTETARAAFQAGTGHVLSTLAIAVIVWIAGATVAKRYGSAIDTVSSLALIGFGLWIAVSAWREQHRHQQHSHNESANAAHHADEHRARIGAGASKDARSRTALLLIVGSSPMVEGIPAFFAAGKYGVGLIAVMSLVFCRKHDHDIRAALCLLGNSTPASQFRCIRTSWRSLERRSDSCSRFGILGLASHSIRNKTLHERFVGLARRLFVRYCLSRLEVRTADLRERGVATKSQLVDLLQRASVLTCFSLSGKLNVQSERGVMRIAFLPSFRIAAGLLLVVLLGVVGCASPPLEESCLSRGAPCASRRDVVAQ